MVEAPPEDSSAKDVSGSFGTKFQAKLNLHLIAGLCQGARRCAAVRGRIISEKIQKVEKCCPVLKANFD
jgi:hypothetical protein